MGLQDSNLLLLSAIQVECQFTKAYTSSCAPLSPARTSAWLDLIQQHDIVIWVDCCKDLCRMQKNTRCSLERANGQVEGPNWGPEYRLTPVALVASLRVASATRPGARAPPNLTTAVSALIPLYLSGLFSTVAQDRSGQDERPDPARHVRPWGYRWHSRSVCLINLTDSMAGVVPSQRLNSIHLL